MSHQHLRPTQIPLNDLAMSYVQAGETLYLAVHDDIAARVRLAHPDAEHLDISFDTNSEVRLHGIWSAQQTATSNCRLLYDPENDAEQSWRDGALDVEELVDDLNRVLTSGFLYRWSLIEPHPVHGHSDRLWITLPPADRASTVAGIVRRHVPNAESLICLFEASHRGIAVGFEQITLNDGESVHIPCPRCSPESEDGPWPHNVSYELAHVLAQLYALPHLRSRHLTPCVDLTSEHEGQLWQLVFPYAAPAQALATRP